MSTNQSKSELCGGRSLAHWVDQKIAPRQRINGGPSPKMTYFLGGSNQIRKVRSPDTPAMILPIGALSDGVNCGHM